MYQITAKLAILMAHASTATQLTDSISTEQSAYQTVEQPPLISTTTAVQLEPVPLAPTTASLAFQIQSASPAKPFSTTMQIRPASQLAQSMDTSAKQ